MDPQTNPASWDEAVAQLAGRQWGVVARRQLLALGLGADAIRHRIERGRLRRLHRGVYAVGHLALAIEGHWMAAVLAGGPGAVLSHGAAAAHRGLRRPTGRIDVTVPVRRERRGAATIHRSPLPPDEWDVHRGIPTTTVARTIFDLAGCLKRQYVEQAFHEAEYRGLTSPTTVAELLERHPRRPGAPVLRTILAQRGGGRTRTEMEADFLAFLDAHGLPRPTTNVARTIHERWIEADALWRGHGLIVELDGGSHRTEARFHSDRARDRANLADGMPTVRVTLRHLRDEPDELATDLRRLLAGAGRSVSR